MDLTELNPFVPLIKQVVVLSFGIIIIWLEINRKKEGWGTNSISIVVVTLVVIAVMFLSTTTIDQDKYLNGFIGLLASIVGYVFGQTKYGPKDKKDLEESIDER